MCVYTYTYMISHLYVDEHAMHTYLHGYIGMDACLLVTQHRCTCYPPETYTCLKASTTQSIPLTAAVAINSSLPPTSHRYFTMSKCPSS